MGQIRICCSWVSVLYQDSQKLSCPHVARVCNTLSGQRRSMCAGPVSAVISEERGSLTTEESVRIPLKALADHSLSVRKTALQDIRNILHQHRSWLVGLLPANTPADGTAANGQHAVLLSSLLGALLKCCDPEVKCTCAACCLQPSTLLLPSVLAALPKWCDS